MLSTQQNKALHLFFHQVAGCLNDTGYTFKIEISEGIIFESVFNKRIVKEQIWKKIQYIKFGIESTQNLHTWQIDEILDSFILFFADQKKQYYIKFPSKFNSQHIFDEYYNYIQNKKQNG